MSEIKRPVTAERHSWDDVSWYSKLAGPDGRQIANVSDQEEAEEIAACINLAPKLAYELKGLLMCQTDSDWAQGVSQSLAVLAEWEKAVKP